jgi:phosphatidylserine decarboxylase
MVEERLPLAKEGLPFVLGAAFLALMAALNGSILLTIIFSLITFFCMFFFRDPERSFTTQQDAVISPADGKVVHLSEVNGTSFKLSIFMSLWDVHVNRVPVDSIVTHVEYRPGKFHAADGMRASAENEQNTLTLKTETGRIVVMTQVAGLVARRIVCRAKVGDKLSKGERFGLIRMGSRLDLLLPSNFIPHIKPGEHVRAGQTILGILP